MSATDHQVAGDHYKKLKIQPIEYILANEMQFCEGAIIKYISRWRDKGGIEDLRKIKHFCDFLIENEYLVRRFGKLAPSEKHFHIRCATKKGEVSETVQDILNQTLRCAIKSDPKDRVVSAATVALTDNEFKQLTKDLREWLLARLQSLNTKKDQARLYQLGLLFGAVTGKVKASPKK